MEEQLECPSATYINTGFDSGRGEKEEKEYDVICLCFRFVRAPSSTAVSFPYLLTGLTGERHLASVSLTFHLLKSPSIVHASGHFQSTLLCF